MTLDPEVALLQNAYDGEVEIVREFERALELACKRIDRLGWQTRYSEFMLQARAEIKKESV